MAEIKLQKQYTKGIQDSIDIDVEFNYVVVAVWNGFDCATVKLNKDDCEELIALLMEKLNETDND